MDETWICYYTPESREGSKQWVKPSESEPKRPKTKHEKSNTHAQSSLLRDVYGEEALKDK